VPSFPPKFTDSMTGIKPLPPPSYIEN
jgi:hypothetical protein